jgi:hypothetical protein
MKQLKKRATSQAPGRIADRPASATTGWVIAAGFLTFLLPLALVRHLNNRLFGRLVRNDSERFGLVFGGT